jgi:hypothetical protein
VALGWGLWEAPARFLFKAVPEFRFPLNNRSSANATDEQTLDLQNEKSWTDCGGLIDMLARL